MAKKNAFNYFKAFEQQAALAVQEADILIEAVESFSSAEELKPVLDRMHQVENQGDEINHDIFGNVAVEFITPIEREDIISLSQNLDSVLDDIEDVVLRMYMFDVKSMDENAHAFAVIIKNACVALSTLMQELETYKKHPKEIHALLVKVNDCEEEGDRLYMAANRNLYDAADPDPINVVAWTEIYKRMERCCDACEHVADTVSMVLLKNS